MFLRYLSLMCLCTSWLFAESFTLDVYCCIKDDGRLVKIDNMRINIDEHQPVILKKENLDFEFNVLWHSEEAVAVETVITRRTAENNGSTILAQPALVAGFGQLATVTNAETKINGETEIVAQLKLLASKKD